MGYVKKAVKKFKDEVSRPIERTFLPESVHKPLDKFGSALQDNVTEPIKEAGEKYAAPIIGAALNFVPAVGPLLSAGWNTAMAGIQSYQNGGKVNWGDVGKTAAISGAGAALSMGAGKLASNAASKASAAKEGLTMGQGLQSANSALDASAGLAGKAAQASSLGRGSALSGFSSPGGYSLGSALTSTAPSTAMNALNAQIAGQGSSSLADYNSSVNNYRPSQAPTTSTSLASPSANPSFLSKAGDSIYNKAISSQTPQAVGKAQLGNIGYAAVADTLAPDGTQALSGMGTGQEILAGEAYTPTGSDVFNAFGGQNYAGTNQITQEQLDQMRNDLGTNVGNQLRTSNDTFTPPGQYEAVDNTPKMNQTIDIMKGFDQSQQDLTQYVNDENLKRYNAAMGIPMPVPARAGF